MPADKRLHQAETISPNARVIDLGDDFKLITGTERARAARRRLFQIILDLGAARLARMAAETSGYVPSDQKPEAEPAP